jgi:hypothetical protein
MEERLVAALTALTTQEVDGPLKNRFDGVVDDRTNAVINEVWAAIFPGPNGRGKAARYLIRKGALQMLKERKVRV